MAAELHQSGTKLASQKVERANCGLVALGVHNRQATAIGLYTIIDMCESSCNVFMDLHEVT